MAGDFATPEEITKSMSAGVITEAINAKSWMAPPTVTRS